MKLIDNINELLGNDLKMELEQAIHSMIERQQDQELDSLLT
jgi:hypothetical protein